MSDFNSVRAPCVRCGNLLHTGEGRVIVSFSASELAELAENTLSIETRRRLLCALSLLDSEYQRDHI